MSEPAGMILAAVVIAVGLFYGIKHNIIDENPPVDKKKRKARREYWQQKMKEEENNPPPQKGPISLSDSFIPRSIKPNPIVFEDNLENRVKKDDKLTEKGEVGLWRKVRWGMVVAVLSLMAAAFAGMFVAYIFEGGGERLSAGDKIWEAILSILAFGTVLHYGCKLGDYIDQKTYKSSPSKDFTPEERKAYWANYDKEMRKNDRVGCLVWLGMGVGAAILAMLIYKK